MTQITSLPSYADFTDLLQKTKLGITAAEAHGLACGFICAQLKKNQGATLWLQLILGQKTRHTTATAQRLQQVYVTSLTSLQDFSFEFNLLLPDDEESLQQRTEALGLWCQGFLTGLTHAQIPIEHREPGEVTDALHDLTEIAQVNYEVITESNEDETAYTELVEYVRIAVLLIFNQLGAEETLHLN